MDKIGVLFVGILGHLATTVMVGALALRRGLCSTTGMVTELDDFSPLTLVEPKHFIFGGWDIRIGTPLENASTLLQEINPPHRHMLLDIEEELKTIATNIFPGTAKNCGAAINEMAFNEEGRKNGRPVKEIISRLIDDIHRFKEKHSLERVVVVNLASTEPPLSVDKRHLCKDSIHQIIEKNDETALRASTLYACAAIYADCPYINFTPSNGALVPGLIDLALERGVPVMGNDGKTGETLVKSALAPMFACRNFKVLSWEGYNILGNMDGRVLAHPENKSSKVKSKDQVLSKILGYRPHSEVSIDYVPSLGDWKTAWDFVHFEGFLHTKMSLQFTWQGCDSALAAPLVLDLIRLGVFSSQNKEKGLMKHLACFFKSPIEVEEHNLFEQFRMLKDYIETHHSGSYHAAKSSEE